MIKKVYIERERERKKKVCFHFFLPEPDHLFLDVQ